MAVYLRGETYWVDFYVDRKRVQESTGTRNKREAEKQAMTKRFRDTWLDHFSSGLLLPVVDSVNTMTPMVRNSPSFRARAALLGR